MGMEHPAPQTSSKRDGRLVIKALVVVVILATVALIVTVTQLMTMRGLLETTTALP